MQYTHSDLSRKQRFRIILATILTFIIMAILLLVLISIVSGKKPLIENSSKNPEIGSALESSDNRSDSTADVASSTTQTTLSKTTTPDPFATSDKLPQSGPADLTLLAFLAGITTFFVAKFTLDLSERKI